MREIVHSKPQGYFECLLQLPVDKLEAMLASPDFPRYRNQDFLRLLKGEGIELGLLALEDGAPPAIEDGMADFAAMVPAPIMPVVRPFQRRFGNGMFKVMFDGCSHQSGARRAYIKCGNDGHSADVLCCRYTHVHLHSSEDACCAFLIAWAMHGRGTLDREAHKYFYTSGEQLATATAIVER